MRESDKPALEAMVEEHEGPESAHLAAYWFERQPAGFVAKVALHETSTKDREVDPAVREAWQYLEHYAPLERRAV